MQSSTEHISSTTSIISNVAAVTVAFWVMKILVTTRGETAGDFLSMTLDLGYYIAFAITFTTLAVIIFFQIRALRFNPALFWLAVVATTTRPVRKSMT